MTIVGVASASGAVVAVSAAAGTLVAVSSTAGSWGAVVAVSAATGTEVAVGGTGVAVVPPHADSNMLEITSSTTSLRNFRIEELLLIYVWLRNLGLRRPGC
jgi:hypothetical protein